MARKYDNFFIDKKQESGPVMVELIHVPSGQHGTVPAHRVAEALRSGEFKHAEKA